MTSSDYRKITAIKANIANYNLLHKIVNGRKIDIVFHLAAEALVGRCHNNPLRTFSTNIKGTWNLLEACRSSKTIKSIIAASSDKAYGSHKKLPYDEKFSLAGSHPYDVSKSCADLLAHTYFHTYGLPVCVTRCGNVYGPGDFNLSRIVPDAIVSAIEDKILVIRSDGKFTRDYIYVEDVVSGYLDLAQKMNGSNLLGEAFNFSNDKPISVLDLVKTVYEIMDRNSGYKVLSQAQNEIRHQYLCSSKARKILGWKPQYDFRHGLKKTVQWYKECFGDNEK